MALRDTKSDLSNGLLRTRLYLPKVMEF